MTEPKGDNVNAYNKKDGKMILWIGVIIISRWIADLAKTVTLSRKAENMSKH